MLILEYTRKLKTAAKLYVFTIDLKDDEQGVYEQAVAARSYKEALQYIEQCLDPEVEEISDIKQLDSKQAEGYQFLTTKKPFNIKRHLIKNLKTGYELPMTVASTAEY